MKVDAIDVLIGTPSDASTVGMERTTGASDATAVNHVLGWLWVLASRVAVQGHLNVHPPELMKRI
jgi:hypothetical protein